MKSKLLFILLSVLTIVGLGSCDDESTAGYTGITYYPILEVLGESSIILDIGTTFVDPGYYAELNGEDVTDQVEVVSNVNTAVGGVYSVSYKITNEDGFSVSGSRTIYVKDPTPSIIYSGIHTTAPGTFRFWLSSGAVVNFSGFEILILQTEPGVFYISDFMGGYYDQRVGYGPAYAMTGYFQLNDDNTITPLSGFVAGWGDSYDYLKDSSVDPVTGQITYKLGYAGLMEYTIILN